MDDMISISDMDLIYQITDDLGIDRESIRVELTKEDPGLARRTADGMVEIIIPLTIPIESWISTLKKELE
jgi:hypothetical protein